MTVKSFDALSASPDSPLQNREGNRVGLALAVSLALLIAVPILQVSLVGSLSRIVPAVIVALAIASVIHRSGRLRASTPMVLLVVYLGAMLLSTFQASDPAGPNQSRAHLILGVAIMSMALLCNERERRTVANALVALAVVQGAYSLFEAFVQPGPLWGYSRFNANGLPILLESQLFTGTIRAQGSLGQPLVLAFLMIVGIGLVIGFRPLPRVWMNVAVIAICLGGILAAGSRSGLAVAAVILLFSARTFTSRTILGVYAAAWGVAMLTLFGFWESTVYQRFLGSDSLGHRQSSLSSLGDLLGKQPADNILFGNGFWSTERLYRTGVLPSSRGFFALDNQVISTVAEVGIVGLLAMASLGALALFHGDRRLMWAIVAAFAMWWTFEVLLWPSSYSILLALVGISVRPLAKRVVHAQPQVPLVAAPSRTRLGSSEG